MFSKTKTLKSTKDYYKQIKTLRSYIDHADGIVIGAGAGLSSSAGLKYDGSRFYDNFFDFAKKYGLEDMYLAGFYPYETLEEYWAYWSRHIYLNRYYSKVGTVYKELLQLVKDKDYFVITTNVDHCFQKAGFDKQRLFYSQGDYGLWQCSKACHLKTYDNQVLVKKMVEEQKDMKIPTALIPYCPYCGLPMTMNLRIDGTFVQDEGWYNAAERYYQFLKNHKDHYVLFLELGVGNNTPTIIKYPFWNFTAKNKNAMYACINNQSAYCPPQIEKQSVFIKLDIARVIKDILSYKNDDIKN